MFKKASILIIFTTLIASLIAGCNLFCSSDSCGCDPPGPAKDFSILGFETSDLILTSNTIDTTQYYDYQNRFKVIEISELEFEALDQKNLFLNMGIGTAYACSPIPPKALNTFNTIKVINKKELVYAGENYGMDSDISELFLISVYPTAEGTPIPDFLNQVNQIYFGENFYLRLANAPEVETELLLDIQISLDDNQEYFLSNRSLRVK